MMVVLKKAARFDLLLQGEYIKSKNPDDVCSYKCPKCGNATRISKQNHTVNYFGELVPAVMCPHMCNFNDSLVLDDWVPDAKGSA